MKKYAILSHFLSKAEKLCYFCSKKQKKLFWHTFGYIINVPQGYVQIN